MTHGRLSQHKEGEVAGWWPPPPIRPSGSGCAPCLCKPPHRGVCVHVTEIQRPRPAQPMPSPAFQVKHRSKHTRAEDADRRHGILVEP